MPEPVVAAITAGPTPTGSPVVTVAAVVTITVVPTPGPTAQNVPTGV